MLIVIIIKYIDHQSIVMTMMQSPIMISIIIFLLRVFSTSGEGLDCGDEAAEWFDQFLEKTGLRLFNGQNKNLTRRYMKDDPVWQDAAKDGDRVRIIGNATFLHALDSWISSLTYNIHCRLYFQMLHPYC